jgi:hypothetical protein
MSGYMFEEINIDWAERMAEQALDLQRRLRQDIDIHQLGGLIVECTEQTYSPGQLVVLTQRNIAIASLAQQGQRSRLAGGAMLLGAAREQHRSGLSRSLTERYHGRRPLAYVSEQWALPLQAFRG